METKMCTVFLMTQKAGNKSQTNKKPVRVLIVVPDMK